MKIKNIHIYAIILTILTIIEGMILILNAQGLTLINDPLSAMGNIAENYPIFFVGIGILAICATIFFISIFKEEHKKPILEIYILPILIFLTLIIPYNKDLPLARLSHTIIGISGAILMLWIMYRFSKEFSSKNKLIEKLSKQLPIISMIGTTIIAISTGINTIMQIFYIGTVLIWTNLVSFELKKSKK